MRCILACRYRSSSDCQRDFNHENSVTCVALHPNQTELISGDQDGRIVRWDLRANQCTEHLIPELDTAVRSIAISSDARLLAGVNNKGNCYIWQLNGSDVCPLKMVKVHQPAYALKCKFSPDDKKFVTTSSDRTARVWVCTLLNHSAFCVFIGCMPPPPPLSLSLSLSLSFFFLRTHAHAHARAHTHARTRTHTRTHIHTTT